MKSIVDEVENTNDDVTFPQMYKNNNSRYIVLFTNKTTGTVIATKGASISLGFYSCNWSPCCGTSVWTRLPAGSSVTLVQEDTH